MAAATQPCHVVDILVAKPTEPYAGCRWTQLAGRIEGYREEWTVEPGQLRERPRDRVRAQEWDASIQAVSSRRPAARNLGRGIEVGIGVEL